MAKEKHLNHEEFLKVVENTPLVSIDLIVHDPNGKVLLGYRKNRPARNTWFVPGGVIRKDERIVTAIQRIAKIELGLEISSAQTHFKGVYEHLYPDNFAEVRGISTHYIVLAYEFQLTSPLVSPPPEQHSEYRWLTPQEILDNPTVHKNTKAYFMSDPTVK
jgi:colanic acid biosynthesis protein WcaH